MWLREPLIKDGVQMPASRDKEGVGLLLKFQRMHRLLVNELPLRRWEERSRSLLRALPALPVLPVCVYEARSEHSVVRATENTDGK